jgi:exodeoxyribonuclease VII large subunit
MKRKAFSVYEINKYIKSLIENDFLLNDVYIEAEISNFKLHSSGHMYFTLKDDRASINCVMFKGNAMSVPFSPEEGMKVFAAGHISLYEKTGQYQLYIKTLEPSGKGSLYLAYEQLKEKLSKEGLFDAKHKINLPKYPKTVCIITSQTGAAVRDVISVCKRHNRNINLVVRHAIVQGEESAKSIVSAITEVNNWGGCEVIILCRGGGSIEDLWSFNKEEVARSIFKSKIPIISAVGHETDFTIADFVSDMRAPTPSVGAEIASFNLQQINYFIEKQKANLLLTLNNKINSCKQNLFFLTKAIEPVNLLSDVQEKRIYIKSIYNDLNKNILFKISANRQLLANKVLLLENVSPLYILKKGYTLLKNKEGNIVKSISEISKGDEMVVKLNDGEIDVVVHRMKND